MAWPTVEYGRMSPKSNAKLGLQRQITDPREREEFIQDRVNDMLTHGQPLNAAMFLENDNVIDPADTRFWILTALRSKVDRA